MQVKLRWKRSLLVTSEISGIFVLTLTGDDKYTSYKSKKFEPAVQKQLSKKQKISYHFFVACLESTLNFLHFEKKDQTHSSTKSNIFDRERFCYLVVLKTMF